MSMKSYAINLVELGGYPYDYPDWNKFMIDKSTNMCDKWVVNEELIEDASWEEISTLLMGTILYYKDELSKERKKKEPARDFTIAEILAETEKYVVVKDTNGRVHGINLSGFKLVEK